MAWWQTLDYPRVAKSAELAGRTFVLDPDRPPERTQFPGMQMVFVKEIVSGQVGMTYKVMVTEQDISKAIDAMINKKTFKFLKVAGKDFASILKNPLSSSSVSRAK